MNDASSLETKEPVQKAPFRILISEHNMPVNANFVADEVRLMNKEGQQQMAELVTVKSPQTSLDILLEAEREGQPFNIVVVPGRSNGQIVGPGLLAAIKKKDIPTRVLVLTTDPTKLTEAFDLIDKDDIHGEYKWAIVINRNEVLQKGEMATRLNTERKRQQNLNTNGR